jgi:hypothetical protein
MAGTEEKESCGHCGVPDEQSEEDVLWSKCVHCQQPFHNLCVKISGKLPDGHCWNCPACAKDIRGALGNSNKLSSVSGDAKNPPKNQKNLKKEIPVNLNAPLKGSDLFEEDLDEEDGALMNELREHQKRVQELEDAERRRLEKQQKAEEAERQRLDALKNQKPLKLRKNEEFDEEVGPSERDRLRQELQTLKARERAREKEVQRNALIAEIARLKARESAMLDEEASRYENEPPRNPPPQQHTSQKDPALNLLEVFVQRQVKIQEEQVAMSALPIFTGNEGSTSWMTWLQHYHNTKGSLSPERDMIRLEKSIKGPARGYVDTALSVPNNAAAVLAILNLRYGNVDKIIQERMRKLENLAAPVDANPETIVNFYEFLLNIRATLVGVEASAYLEAPQTLNTIVDKLPPTAQTAWLMHKRKTEKVGLADFILWYEPTYFTAATRLASRPPTRKQRVNHHDDESPIRPEEKKQGCPLCRKDSHHLITCRRFAKKDLSDRWAFVTSIKWCFRCLKGKHWKSDCSSTVKCGAEDCEEDHHKLLHKRRNPEKAEEAESSDGETNAHHRDSTTTFYRVVPVNLINADKCVQTWAFLDDGSGPTLLSKKLAERLQLPLKPNELQLSWSDGTTRKMESSTVEVAIQGIAENRQYNLRNVQTVPELDLPIPRLNLEELKARYTHLEDVKIPDIPASKPELLIGLEHVKLMIPHKIREGAWNQPVATKTKIGWAVYGRARGAGEMNNYSCSIHECGQEEGEKIENYQNKLASLTAFVKKSRSRGDENSSTDIEDDEKSYDENLKMEFNQKPPLIKPPEKITATSQNNPTVCAATRIIFQDEQTVGNSSSLEASDKIVAEQVGDKIFNCCLILIVLAIKLAVCLWIIFEFVLSNVRESIDFEVPLNWLRLIKRRFQKIVGHQIVGSFEVGNVKDDLGVMWFDYSGSVKRFAGYIFDSKACRLVDDITEKPRFSKVPKARLFSDENMSRDPASFSIIALKVKLISWINLIQGVWSKSYNQLQTKMLPLKYLDEAKALDVKRLDLLFDGLYDCSRYAREKREPRLVHRDLHK